MTGVPTNWVECRLGDLIEFKYGKSLPARSRCDGAFSVFGSNGQIDTHNEALTAGPTIVIGRKGSIGEVHFSPSPCFPIDTTYYVDEFFDLDEHFVEYLLHTLPLTEMDRASAIPGLNRDDAYALAIGLPPLAEQRRIVDKLDLLLARTRQAREELEHIPTLIEHYKQAILAAAYDWATEHAIQTVELGDILVEMRNGWGKPPAHTPPGVPILKISAIRPMTVRMDERRYYVLEEGEDVSRYNLRSGDLLFTRYNGNPDFVASCGMIRELDESLIYPDKLIRVRLDTESIAPSFVEAIASAPQARVDLSPFIKSAAGQHGISGRDLKKLPLPIPSLAVQREIIDFVETAFSSINQADDESHSASYLVDHLEQAILAKAFRGELVPQDPDDEPASVLLERIREERAAGSNGKKRKKRK